MSRFLVLLLLAGCPGTSPELTWWEDPCGRRDPVARECAEGVAKVEVGDEPTCADEGLLAGEICTENGATCIDQRALACEDDLETTIASPSVLTCGTEPPDDLCPESRRAAKRDIAYLDESGRASLAHQMLELRIATYRYRDPTNGEGPKLGYLLDDAPDLPSSGDGRVDLYAYTSAILATVQEQQVQLNALQQQVETLRTGVCPE